MQTVNLEGANVFVKAHFCRIKVNALHKAKVYLSEGYGEVDLCKITEAVTMTAEEYDAFVLSLATSRPWLADKGGASSHVEPMPLPSHQWPEAFMKEWKAQSFRLVLSVWAPGRETIYVDPQGYDYVRYVGMMPKSIYLPQPKEVAA
jgi:hypothetical protein